MPALFRKVPHWFETHATLARWILAGPVAFLVALFAMAALPLVLPVGPGGVDHLVLPVVLFPLIWAAATLYPVVSGTVWLTAAVMTGLLALEIYIVLSVFV